MSDHPLLYPSLQLLLGCVFFNLYSILRVSAQNRLSEDLTHSTNLGFFWVQFCYFFSGLWWRVQLLSFNMERNPRRMPLISPRWFYAMFRSQSLVIWLVKIWFFSSFLTFSGLPTTCSYIAVVLLIWIGKGKLFRWFMLKAHILIRSLCFSLLPMYLLVLKCLDSIACWVSFSEFSINECIWWFCRFMINREKMKKLPWFNSQDGQTSPHCKYQQGHWKVVCLLLRGLIFLPYQVLVLLELDCPLDQIQLRSNHPWKICFLKKALGRKICPWMVRRPFSLYQIHLHQMVIWQSLLLQGLSRLIRFSSLHQWKQHILYQLHQVQMWVLRLCRADIWRVILISL